MNDITRTPIASSAADNEIILYQPGLKYKVSASQYESIGFAVWKRRGAGEAEAAEGEE